MTVVLGGEVLEAELAVAAHFPQETGVQFLGAGRGAFEQFARRGLAELQQHVAAFQLHAFAVRGLHLQRGVVISENRPGLEGPVLF